MEPSESRLDAARRRLRIARYAIAAAAAGAFPLLGLVVRQVHPATSSRSAARASASRAQQDDGFSFGGGASIAPAPATRTPDVRTGGS